MITDLSEFNRPPVEEFIENFKRGHDVYALESCFTNGNCYHFALLLEALYGGIILYDQVDGHFISFIDGCYYDITGRIEPVSKAIEFDSELRDSDPLWFNRLLRDCVYKVQS